MKCVRDSVKTTREKGFFQKTFRFVSFCRVLATKFLQGRQFVSFCRVLATKFLQGGHCSNRFFLFDEVRSGFCFLMKCPRSVFCDVSYCQWQFRNHMCAASFHATKSLQGTVVQVFCSIKCVHVYF